MYLSSSRGGGASLDMPSLYLYRRISKYIIKFHPVPTYSGGHADRKVVITKSRGGRVTIEAVSSFVLACRSGRQNRGGEIPLPAWPRLQCPSIAPGAASAQDIGPGVARIPGTAPVANI